MDSRGANAPGNVVGHAPPPAESSGASGSPAPPGGSNSKAASQSHGSSQTGNPSGNRGRNEPNGEQAAKNAVGAGADDTLVLTALVLGFTLAVGGVVMAAGRRGGRRVH